MNTLKQDALFALKSMAIATWLLVRDFLQFAFIAGTIIGIIWSIGYCLIHWTLYSITTTMVVMLISWFLMELDNAQFIRKMNEKDAARRQNVL